MQYSGAQGNASSSGYALQMKGGGVIPPVLLEECRVPRFYKDAIASCGATNASHLPNTTAVYNLMVASGLPRPMLSYIWTIVNRTLPGQLTRQEFYSCLALIALAQKGQTLCALSSVSTLPVPQLQLPGPYGSQSKQGQPTGNSATAASAPSLNLFGNVSPSNSSQQPASTIPTSVSVQSFGRKQFPSAAETAALSFTRSLDMRSSQRAAASLSSNKQVGSFGPSPNISTGGTTGPMKSSQSIPATMNFASSPAPSSVPVSKTARKASSELDEIFSDVKVKTAPTTGSEQVPFGHKPQTFSTLESPVPKPNSYAVNPLDDLFDISLPSTSSKSQNPLVEAASRGATFFSNASESTGAASQPSQNKPNASLDDEFGEMTVPTQSEATPSMGPVKLGRDGKLLEKHSTTNAKSDSYDVYAAVKMVEGSSSNREDTERTELWKRCIDEAYGSFEHAEKNLLSYPKETIDAVAQTKRGSRYILALEKIYEMVIRISRGHETELADKAETLKMISRIWEKLKAYVYFSESSPRAVSNGLIVKKCEICLSEIAEEALLEFAGNVYHKQCANFWINRIYPVLPKLS